MKRKTDRPVTRRERALQTRRRMLRAAYDLFCERGFSGTTMELIAEKAGVAVQTLYFTFHTKSAILEETLGACILGFEAWDPGLEARVVADPRKAFAEVHPWFPAFDRAKSAKEALGIFLDASMGIFERAAPLHLVQVAAAASEPQLKVSVELAEQRRAEGFELVVEKLAARSRLRRGMTIRRATDVLLTLLSAQTFSQFTQGRGWSTAEYREWLAWVLEWQWFGEPRPR